LSISRSFCILAGGRLSLKETAAEIRASDEPSGLKPNFLNGEPDGPAAFSLSRKMADPVCLIRRSSAMKAKNIEGAWLFDWKLERLGELATFF